MSDEAQASRLEYQKWIQQKRNEQLRKALEEASAQVQKPRPSAPLELPPLFVAERQGLHSHLHEQKISHERGSPQHQKKSHERGSPQDQKRDHDSFLVESKYLSSAPMNATTSETTKLTMPDSAALDSNDSGQNHQQGRETARRRRSSVPSNKYSDQGAPRFSVINESEKEASNEQGHRQAGLLRRRYSLPMGGPLPVQNKHPSANNGNRNSRRKSSFSLQDVPELLTNDPIFKSIVAGAQGENNVLRSSDSGMLNIQMETMQTQLNEIMKALHGQLTSQPAVQTTQPGESVAVPKPDLTRKTQISSSDKTKMKKKSRSKTPSQSIIHSMSQSSVRLSESGNSLGALPEVENESRGTILTQLSTASLTKMKIEDQNEHEPVPEIRQRQFNSEENDVHDSPSPMQMHRRQNDEKKQLRTPSSNTLLQAAIVADIETCHEIVLHHFPFPQTHLTLDELKELDEKDEMGNSILQILVRHFVDRDCIYDENITKAQEEKVKDLYQKTIVRLIELGADVNYCAPYPPHEDRVRDKYYPSAFFDLIDHVEDVLALLVVQVCERTYGYLEDPMEKLKHLPNPNRECLKLEEDSIPVEMTCWHNALEKSSCSLLSVLMEAQKIAELVFRDDFEDPSMAELETIESLYISDWCVDNTNAQKWREHGSPVVYALKEAKSEASIKEAVSILLKDMSTDADNDNFLTLFDPNAFDENQQTMLHVACDRGYDTIVGMLLRYCLHHRQHHGIQININAVDVNGCTALMLAIEQGHTKVVQELFLRNNLDYHPAVAAETVEPRGFPGDIPAAAPPPPLETDYPQSPQVFLAASRRTSAGFPALSPPPALHKAPERALSRPHRLSSPLTDSVRPPRRHDLHRRSKYLDFTPLHYACACPSELDEVVLILCKHKANANLVDVHGFSPLHLASMLGHIMVVKTLLRYNANPSKRIEERADCNLSSGEAAIHLAAANGHINVVGKLIAKGSEVSMENNEGQTALHFAYLRLSNLMTLLKSCEAEAGGQTEQASFRFSDANVREEKNKWFLFNTHDKSMYKQWVSENRGNQNALRLARESQEMLIKILLDANADLDHEDKAGRTAFVNEARLIWFEEHKKIMTEIFDHPNKVGYDAEVFIDKRTQVAVKHMWIDTGQRARALRELLWWLLFTMMVTIVAVWYSGGNDRQAYTLESGMREKFLGEEWDSFEQKVFEEVATIEEWHLYLSGPMFAGLYEGGFWYQDDGGMRQQNENLAMINGFVSLLGRPRYRQIRTVPDFCIDSTLAFTNNSLDTCFGAATMQTFGEFQTHAEDQSDVMCGNLTIPYEERSALVIWGDFGRYNGDGVSVTLPPDAEEARALLGQLEECNYVSLNTRAAVVEFTLYSRSAELFSHVRLFLEQTASGSVTASSKWNTLKLVGYASTMDNYRIFVEILMVVMLLRYITSEISAMSEPWDPGHKDDGTPPRFWWYLVLEEEIADHDKRQPKLVFTLPRILCPSRPTLGFYVFKTERTIPPYWVNTFNYLDVFLMMLFITVISVHIATIVEEKIYISEWLGQQAKLTTEYYEIHQLIRLVIARQYLLAIISFLCYIKCLEYIQVSEFLAIPVIVIGGMLLKLMSFFLIFGIFILAFAMFNYVVYGLTYEHTNTITKAILHSFKASLGDIDFDGMLEVDSGAGIFMALLASFLLVILLLNLLVAIMNEAYEDVKATAEARWCYMQFRMILTYERQKRRSAKVSSSENSRFP